MNEEKKSSYMWQIIAGVITMFIIISVLYPIFVNHPVAVLGLRSDGKCFPETLYFTDDEKNNYTTEINFQIKNSGNSGGSIFAQIFSDKILSKTKESNKYEQLSKKTFFLEPRVGFSTYKFTLMNNNYSEIDDFSITLEYGYYVKPLLIFSIPFQGGKIQVEYQHKSGDPEQMYSLYTEN